MVKSEDLSKSYKKFKKKSLPTQEIRPWYVLRKKTDNDKELLDNFSFVVIVQFQCI